MMVLVVSGRSNRINRGPKDHLNITISHSGSKAEIKGDTRNHDV